jgi:hypothetical protein
MRDSLPDPSSKIQCSSATPPFRSDTQVHLHPCETDAKQRLNEAARFGVNNALEPWQPSGTTLPIFGHNWHGTLAPMAAFGNPDTP